MRFNHLWVHLEDVFAIMLGVGVVGGVHGNRFAVVVDGDVYGVSECLFNSGTCSAASGKAVND